MTTGDRYRAFARQCLLRAQRATDIKHRDPLLDMATSWVDAAARVDRQQGLRREFNDIVGKAIRYLSDARQAPAIDGNGNGRIEQADGGGQPRQPDGASLDRHGRELSSKRGETSVE